MKNKILNLKDLFNINKGDIISIVGSGGKTSLMFALANELKINYNVLITTSTKIYMPASNMYDNLYSHVDGFINSNFVKKTGLTIISKSIDESMNKLIGINDNDLIKISEKFDIIIIEADGSRNLPLKGWKKHEPPVLQKTNKTIGIIPIKALNKKIDKSFVYGYDEFINIVGEEDYFNFECAKKICTHEEGLFKNSKGEQYLFINQADNEELIQRSYSLVKYLKQNIDNINFKICFGSLEAEEYYEY